MYTIKWQGYSSKQNTSEYRMSEGGNVMDIFLDEFEAARLTWK